MRTVRTGLPLVAVLLASMFHACQCEPDDLNERRPPAIVLGADVIDFGDVPIGLRATRTFTVRNDGELPLQIEQLRLLGAAGFAVSDSPSVVEAATSSDVTVVFQPTVAGPVTADLTLISNDPNARERTVELRGNGIDAVACGPCDSPPPSRCVSPTESLVYDLAGTCEDGQCRYHARVVPCDAACTATGICTSSSDGGTPDAGLPDAGPPRSDGGINLDCQQLGIDVRVTSDAFSSGWPNIVWNGTAYGIAWMSQLSEASSNGADVRFAARAADGSELVAPVAVTTAGGLAQQPSMAWDGTSYGVAWSDVRDGDNELYFRRHDASGQQALVETRLTQEQHLQFGVRLIWNSTSSEYAYAWMDGRDVAVSNSDEIYFGRMTQSGSLIGEVRVTNRTTWKDFPALVFTGSEYVVAWPEYDASAALSGSIRMQRLTAGGAPVGPEIVVAESSGGVAWPMLEWTGTELAVAWADGRSGNYDVYFARVSADGTLLTGAIPVTTHSGNSFFPSPAWTGSGFGIAYQDDRAGGPQIFFRKLSADGTPQGAEMRMTCIAFPALLPSLIWDGTRHALAWTDRRHGNSEIYLKTFTP